MKTYIIMAMVGACSATFAQRGDVIESTENRTFASARTGDGTENNVVDNSVAEFLTTAADARMMDMQEGSLAKDRGTTEAIQEYGETMVKDQRAMLTELRKIAALRGVTLPEKISEEKQEGRDDLAELTGEKFDKKFLKMIIKDHKRDLKQFRRAVNSSDDEVSEFAELYIPVIQSHLVRAKELRRTV